MSSPQPAPNAVASPTIDGGMIAVSLLAIAALFMSIVTLTTRSDGDGATVAAASSTAVTLSEFAIDPGPVAIAVGGSLAVQNTGAVAHNLVVDGQPIRTADLSNGESATLDVSSLAAGTYELFCDIAGHADAGMRAELVVGGEPAGGGGHSGDDVDYAALDAAMTESILAFPAETEGVANQPMVPTVAADGTKVFELTAAITPWEVSPGNIVDAWTYNGTAPGPWIKVEVGDKVRVVLDNQLPMGTDIHWHGVATPNNQDGVAPLTQPLIESGTSFTYEFTAQKKTVGMYHSHHHGQMQVPNGLLGVFQIGDVDLPLGQTVSGTLIPNDLEVAVEFPMVLNDAGVIGYSLNGKSFPATAPITANQGDWILAHYVNEGMQIHPMHQHQFPQLVVAKDGIPLDQPYWADTVNVAPGERYSVLIHATDPGAWVWHCHILNHVEGDHGMFGMVTAIIVS